MVTDVVHMLTDVLTSIMTIIMGVDGHGSIRVIIIHVLSLTCLLANGFA